MLHKNKAAQRRKVVLHLFSNFEISIFNPVVSTRSLDFLPIVLAPSPILFAPSVTFLKIVRIPPPL